jgi:hypothetical protein
MTSRFWAAGQSALRYALGPVAAAVATVWEAAFNANYTYTGSNLIATRSAGAGGQLARGTIGKSSGTLVITVGGSLVSTNCSIGLANAAASATPSFLGDTSDSIGYQNNGSITFNGAGPTSGAGYNVGDVITIVWDGTSVVFKLNGVAQGSPVNVSASMSTPRPACWTGANGAASFSLDASAW